MVANFYNAVAAPLQTRHQHLMVKHAFMRTLWFRTILHLSVILLIISPLYAVLDFALKDISYRMNDKESALVSASTVDSDFIQQADTAITYNRADEAAGDKDLQTVLTLAANKEDATGKKPYQAELSKDAKDGITFSDSEGDRRVSLTPTFTTGQGRLQDDRVIYPTSTTEKHIYSFKNNGIKSDILLTQAPGSDTKTYSWDLGLDSTLEARMLPDGGVGIYSADPTLYSNLQISDQKSQELVDKARTNAQKNTLVFELPRPFILDANNKQIYTGVSYGLTNDKADDKGNKNNATTLTLTATNLKQQAYPLSIDPTITVTTTADFRQNTGDTGNVDFGTDGEIRRGAGGSGALATAVQQNGIFSPARSGHTSVAYNGYLYIIGGTNGTRQNDIQYCSLGSDGAVGSCTQQANAFTTARELHTSVAYNGYLYIIGGDGGSNLNDVQYCPLNSDGTVGACASTTSFTTARSSHTSVAYNGYLYVIGGVHAASDTACNGAASVYCSDVQYAPFNADGTLGTWTATTSFTTARSEHTSVAYNGYFYVIGGRDISDITNIQYAPVNANGTIGTWTATTSLDKVRSGHSSTIANGYLYVSGGYNGLGLEDTVVGAPLRANGTIGDWNLGNVFTTGRGFHASVSHNGYMYIIGGTDGGTDQNDIQRLKVNPLVVGGSISQGTILTARQGHTAVAYNGAIYIAGGCSSVFITCNGYRSDIQRCPLNADGSVGTCVNQTATITGAREGHGSIIYNGYLYIIAGTTGTRQSDIQNCNIAADGTIASCSQQTNRVVTARDGVGEAVAVSDGYLYLTGGNTGSLQNDIQHCKINTDGTVDVCTQQTAMFTTARRGHSTVIYNNYIYIIGGLTGFLRDVIRCSINLSTHAVNNDCTQQANILNQGHGDFSAFVHNGYLYSVGGTYSSGNYLNTVEYCPFNSDGSIGACTTQTAVFTTARQNHATVLWNGFMYITGGYGGSHLGDIQRMQIGRPNGVAGAATQQTSAFATARQGQSSVVAGGYLYIIGGTDGTRRNDIQYCAMGADGVVGSCTLQSGIFPTPRDGHTSVVYDGYLYIIGGQSGASTYENDIQRCRILGNGSVDTCDQQTGAFTTARTEHSSIVHNGYLYIIGGTNGTAQNDIQYCQIYADHTVGTCTQQTSAFATARYAHTSQAYNGYLYITGGYHDTSDTACSPTTNSNYCSDIQYCQLNTNGTVGACLKLAGAFVTPRSDHSTVFYNGYLYVMGGTNGTKLGDIQYCPVRADGVVESCVVLASGFTLARSGHSSVVYGGLMYIIGGEHATADTACNASSTVYCSDIQRVSVGNITDDARYERLIKIGESETKLSSFTVSGDATCRYVVVYKTAGDDGVFGSVTRLDNVIPGAAQSLGDIVKKYIHITVELQGASCGGSASVTSIAVAYISAPTAPTLISPADAALDVSLSPEFSLSTTDGDGDTIKYKIDICSVSDCASVVRSIDQTVSATGWSAASYASGATATYTLVAPALNETTQYWWRAAAIDEAGSSTWSVYSPISTFTTLRSTTPTDISISGGGVTIYGGSELTTGN